jgi:hypothetical protein
MEPVMTGTEHDEDRIRDRAHQIWEGEGKPHGRDKEHWDQAAKELSPAAPGQDRTPDKKLGEINWAEANTKNKGKT